ncbi:MAG TPA: hypothetical protein VGP47_00160 [Parachlamydiaceae bacterium]|nr:hypothetical protein [Parachlamydiaceae bacterium]
MNIINPMIDITAKVLTGTAWVGLKTVERATNLVELAAVTVQCVTGGVLMYDIFATNPDLQAYNTTAMRSFRLVKERFADTPGQTLFAKNSFPTQDADLESLRLIQGVAALAIMTILPAATVAICNNVRSLTQDLILALEHRG